MRNHWALQSGESIEIYDGTDSEHVKVLYRIGVDKIVNGEIKIVRPGEKFKIINDASKLKVVDILTNGSLYVELLGSEGLAVGWYEFLAAVE